jgi:hypothetical protein
MLLTAAFIGVSAAPAQAVEYITTLTYDKNPSNPSDSRLIWKVYHVEGDVVKHVEQNVFRAGSGKGTLTQNTNECLNNYGWLPNGYYDVTLHEYYNGNVIKGIVFRISDKWCSGGSAERTQLFIHSEMTQNHGQYCPTSGDDPQCWEGVTGSINDYKSEGCIKLSYSDIDTFRWQWRRFYGVGQKVSGKLSVIS